MSVGRFRVQIILKAKGHDASTHVLKLYGAYRICSGSSQWRSRVGIRIHHVIDGDGRSVNHIEINCEKQVIYSLFKLVKVYRDVSDPRHRSAEIYIFCREVGVNVERDVLCSVFIGQGQAIAKALGERGKYVEIAGEDHVPLLSNEQALSAMRQFVLEHAK